MKKYLDTKGILIFLIVVSFAALVSADELIEQHGVINSVDTNASRIILKTKNEVLTIEIIPSSKVMIGKERKPLSDVKPGDEVICRFIMKKNKLVCKDLIVKELEEKK